MTIEFITGCAIGLAVLAALWYVFIPPQCPGGCGRMRCKRTEYDPYGAYVRHYYCPACDRRDTRRIPTK